MAGTAGAGARSIIVAAVQSGAAAGRVEENLGRAEAFVENAAGRGAVLVVLPEAYSSGYLATPAIWDAAESRDGSTSRWLARVSRGLGICLGTGFVETDGEDFFNSYMLCGPDGEIVGVCRKRYAESYAFARGDGPNVFETGLGRIGVGICADNQFAFLPRLMSESSVDVMLMPHAAPLRRRRPLEAVAAAEYARIEAQYGRMRDLPRRYARRLGVPVVFATQVGEIERMPGIIGRAMDPRKWRIPGISRIVDSDGADKAELDDVEGVAVAEVVLDPELKREARMRLGESPESNGFGAFARGVVFPIDGALGRRSYERARRAFWSGARRPPASR